MPFSVIKPVLVTRFENANQSSDHSFQGPSCSRTQPYVSVKQKASIESIGPAVKRRKFCGVEYETHSLVSTYIFIELSTINIHVINIYLDLQTLSEETVAQNYGAGNIVSVAPKKTEQNFEMYNVVRRLKSVDSGAIINHFFRCEICEKVLKVVTALNHAALTRHFTKCVGPGKICMSILFNQKFNFFLNLNSVQIDRNILYGFIQDVVRIGVEIGPCDLAKVVLPSKINETNIEQCVEKIRLTATAVKRGSA